MIRKLLVFFLAGLMLTSPVLAQASPQPQTVEHLPPPQSHELADDIAKLSPVRYLPDHLFFPLVTLREKIDRLIQPTVFDKAHFDVVVSGKRIKEAYLLTEKGNYKDAKQTIEEYGKRLDSLSKELLKAQSQGQDVVKTLNLLADHLGRHQNLMAQILATVPQQEKESFKTAFKTPNEKLLEVIALLEKGRPDQAQRLFTRYSVATESAKSQ